jgi:hypothetical protein
MEDVIYQEIWPWGRIIHLKLTPHAFSTSIYKSFLPLTSIPVASIRRVQIERLGLDKSLTISYYKDSTTFVTKSFPADDLQSWRRAFERVGIASD